MGDRGRRYVVITPCRDEAEYLPTTIRSMADQTVRPALWIIVDDGSSDETPRILREAAETHDFIRVIDRPDRGRRTLGSGVVEAFNCGLSTIDPGEYDYLCKLDGDLDLPERYFEGLFEKFESDPRLGTASGKAWMRVGDRLVPERSNDDFSQGQTKLYRRSCFDETGGFVNGVMWDGIDCHRCRMIGWKARSFKDPELRFIHLRQMGSSFRSIYAGRLRWGYGQYFMGTRPLYALAISAYRVFERPWIIGGLLILTGYVNAAIRRSPRYDDPTFRRFLREWQMQRLSSLFLRPFGRKHSTIQ
jgi:glycosyltransferase involved in cell wall biosynthesis